LVGPQRLRERVSKKCTGVLFGSCEERECQLGKCSAALGGLGPRAYEKKVNLPTTTSHRLLV